MVWERKAASSAARAGGAGGEVEGVDEAPVGGVEEGAEVADGLVGDDAVFIFLDGGVDERPLPVVLDAVADAAELFGVVLADAFPWGDVAEVAAQAEDAVGGEIAEGGDEWGVAGGEEFGVIDLGQLVA
jgi:hypothetical protein